MSEEAQVGKTGNRSLWNNKTATRWLQGIEYRVLEDGDDIHDYVNTMVRKELEADCESMGYDARSDETVNSLARMRWSLETVDLRDVKLNPLITESHDLKTGRRFTDRLRERRKDLRRALESGEAAIWPLVLVGDDHFLIDGYCRHSTLGEMGVSSAYCYCGRIRL